MNINMQNIELIPKDGWIWIAERIGEELYPVEKLLYDDGSQTREIYEQRLRLQGSWNIADYKDDLYTVFDFGITGTWGAFSYASHSSRLNIICKEWLPNLVKNAPTVAITSGYINEVEAATIQLVADISIANKNGTFTSDAEAGFLGDSRFKSLLKGVGDWAAIYGPSINAIAKKFQCTSELEVLNALSNGKKGVIDADGKTKDFAYEEIQKYFAQEVMFNRLSADIMVSGMGEGVRSVITGSGNIAAENPLGALQIISGLTMYGTAKPFSAGVKSFLTSNWDNIKNGTVDMSLLTLEIEKAKINYLDIVDNFCGANSNYFKWSYGGKTYFTELDVDTPAVLDIFEKNNFTTVKGVKNIIGNASDIGFLMGDIKNTSDLINVSFIGFFDNKVVSNISENYIYFQDTSSVTYINKAGSEELKFYFSKKETITTLGYPKRINEFFKVIPEEFSNLMKDKKVFVEHVKTGIPMDTTYKFQVINIDTFKSLVRFKYNLSSFDSLGMTVEEIVNFESQNIDGYFNNWNYSGFETDKAGDCNGDGKYDYILVPYSNEPSYMEKFIEYLALPTFGNDNNNLIIGNDEYRYDTKDKNMIVGANRALRNESIYGASGNDTLYGGKGQDQVFGGSGNDIIYGGEYLKRQIEENDLWKSNGNDEDNGIYENKEANDILVGGSGDDRIYGQFGNDIIYGDLTDNGSYNIISTENENTYWKEDASINGGNDYIVGGEGEDELHGGGGNDVLLGGKTASRDTDGLADKLFGGSGNDKFFGGSGNDQYIFDSTKDEGNDLIVDTDRFGDIIIDGKIIKGLLKPDKTISGNPTITWEKSSGTAIKIKYGNNNSITIENFQEGCLGLYTTKLALDIIWADYLIILGGLAMLSPIGAAAGFATAFMIAETLSPPVIRRGDPLVLDLDGDGTETAAMADGVHFDLNADGFAEKAGWVGKDDGLLVYDKNNNGTIDSGRELFGDQTRLRDGRIAESGFEALGEFDTNKDGVIDKNDRDFAKLDVWQDINSDGISQSNELNSLAEMGINSIDLKNETVNKEQNGNIEVRKSTYTKADSTKGTVAEYLFGNNIFDSANVANVVISEETKNLMEVSGAGLVQGLQTAMELDETGELKTN